MTGQVLLQPLRNYNRRYSGQKLKFLVKTREKITAKQKKILREKQNFVPKKSTSRKALSNSLPSPWEIVSLVFVYVCSSLLRSANVKLCCVFHWPHHGKWSEPPISCWQFPAQAQTAKNKQQKEEEAGMEAVCFRWNLQLFEENQQSPICFYFSTLWLTLRTLLKHANRVKKLRKN